MWITQDKRILKIIPPIMFESNSRIRKNTRFETTKNAEATTFVKSKGPHGAENQIKHEGDCNCDQKKLLSIQTSDLHHHSPLSSPNSPPEK